MKVPADVNTAMVSTRMVFPRRHVIAQGRQNITYLLIKMRRAYPIITELPPTSSSFDLFTIFGEPNFSF
jgi:hypothetical protein